MQSRLIAFAFVALLVLSVRASTPADGCDDETGDMALYANYSEVCAQDIACTTAFVSCLGSSSAKNCNKATECIAARFACLNAAAENTTGCPQLNNVHISLLEVASGAAMYSETNADKSCRASACKWLNATFVGAGGSCDLDYSKLCKSPISCVATFVFGGNFTEIIADEALRTELADAIASDFATFTAIEGTFTRRLFIPNGDDTKLVAELETPGVSCTYMAAKIEAAAHNQDWLIKANAIYGRIHPGEKMTVIKGGPGGASSAFSNFDGSSSSSSGTTSGAATQSLLAALALAVLSALLF